MTRRPTHNYKRCVHKLTDRILQNVIGWVQKVTRSLGESAEPITWPDLHNKVALSVVSILQSAPIKTQDEGDEKSERKGCRSRSLSWSVFWWSKIMAQHAHRFLLHFRRHHGFRLSAVKTHTHTHSKITPCLCHKQRRKTAPAAIPTCNLSEWTLDDQKKKKLTLLPRDSTCEQRTDPCHLH